MALPLLDDLLQRFPDKLGCIDAEALSAIGDLSFFALRPSHGCSTSTRRIQPHIGYRPGLMTQIPSSTTPACSVADNAAMRRPSWDLHLASRGVKKFVFALAPRSVDHLQQVALISTS
jgi:hypothetical protein